MGNASQTTAGASMDERALVRGMIAGDEEAFRAFCDAYIPALRRFAASRLRDDPELAREIVQTTLVNAIRRLASFRGESALMTWLCACCRTEIAAHFRRNKNRPAEVELTDELAPATDGPETPVFRDEEATLVHMALDLLPPRHGQVLEWKYLEDLRVNEIAERMSLRPKAAESLLTRARESFRKVYTRLQGRKPS